MQTPSNHTHNTKPRGCPRCGVEKFSASTRKSTKQFIAQSISLWGDRYDYSLVDYTNNKSPVKITCKEHGFAFEQRAGSHIRGLQGCMYCDAARKGDSARKSTGKFIEEALSVWGDRFDYSLVDYRNAHSSVTLACKEHGFSFEQTPNNHLRGHQGCPYCSSQNRGAGMVYLIEIHVPETDEKFLKIGWTTSNVRTRFTKDEFEWKQLNRKMFPNAFLGERWERYMHKMFDDCRYKPKHKFYGATECFGYQYKELIQKTFAEEAKRGN